MSTLVLLVVPAAAAAQAAPPDERAAARAFADITIPAAHEIARVQDSLFTSEPPTCKAERRLARGTERQQLRMFEFIVMQQISALTRRMEPTLTSTVTALYTVPTADPALRKGRAAWRTILRVYTRFGSVPHYRLCSVMRDYVRGDYKPTRAMRRSARMFRQAENWDTRKIDRAMARAVKRLVALGVPAADADAFDGEIEPSDKPVDDEGSRTGAAARSAQAPAPSSPLASLRAAR